MRTFLVAFVLFGLGFVVYHQINQLDLMRDRVDDLEQDFERQAVSPPVKKPVVIPSTHIETHDEKVDRLRRESAQRRKEYCDSHPNLSIRIGCE
jgi:hypothetical protein